MVGLGHPHPTEITGDAGRPSTVKLSPGGTRTAAAGLLERLDPEPAGDGYLADGATVECMNSIRFAQTNAGDLHLEAVVTDGHGTLVLVGEVDVATAWRLGEAMQAMHAEGASMIVVDLARLRFIDASGLRQLVLGLRRQRQRDGDVVLRAPSATTLRVLEIVGLTNLFTIT